MGVLDRFEKRLERFVTGTFAKAFRSEVQPVEIASALRREADNRAAVVSRGRTLTANTYTVELSGADLERLGEILDALGVELRQAVGEHAASQGYSFVGPVTVDFDSAADLDTGMFRVRSATKRPDGSSAAQPQNRGGYDPQSRSNPVVPERAAPERMMGTPRGSRRRGAPMPQAASRAPMPHSAAPPASLYGGDAGPDRPAGTRGVSLDGQFHPLNAGSTVLGRSEASADIVLNDPGCSRRHFEITVDSGGAIATDLGSTNGTKINGSRITSQRLVDGMVLTAGKVSVRFHDPGSRG